MCSEFWPYSVHYSKNKSKRAQNIVFVLLSLCKHLGSEDDYQIHFPNQQLPWSSYWCEEAIARSKKLWPLVRDIVPGEYYNKANIWHWNRAFPQWEGERDQTSGCQDNWQRHLDHTAGMTDWHSLPLIVFPPSLCHISLSPFLTITHIHSFFPFCLCLCPHQPSHRHPVGHHAMPLCHCYPRHLRDKVTPDDWWPQVHAEMSSSL